MKRLDHYWYTRSPWLLLLTPLSLAFRIVSRMRRLGYRLGIVSSRKPELPVIIVGNITAGGTGKTPLVAWLADYLRNKGYKPGIIARGYGGTAAQWPQQVRPDSDPSVVGDEAVMLAGKTHCPMAVAPDRAAAADALVAYGDCDIIISDDGLQHYALRRDIEIAVVDGIRRFGSGFMMPAGPLREPVSRLKEVDLVVVNGLGKSEEHPMRMRFQDVRHLLTGVTRKLSDFRQEHVHAVAGIGHPERFFQSLRQTIRSVDQHEFPDHYRFSPKDIDFDDDRPVLMTEKDAVKCKHFASDHDWFVPVEVEMTDEFTGRLDSLLALRAPLRTSV